VKKTSILLFVIMTCLSLSAYDWTYEFAKPQITDGRVYLENCEMNYKACDPAIAVKPVRLLLPYGQTAKSISIEYSQPQTVPGIFEIKPVSVSGRLSVMPENNLPKRSSVYQQNSFYPQIQKNPEFRMQYKNGHPILISMINPVQYNPVSRTVQYYQKIKIKVETESYVSSLYKHNYEIAKHLKALTDNPSLTDQYPETTRNVDDYDYLIITSNQYLNVFNAFIDFNLNRSLKTKIVSKEVITTNMPGADTQAKIRNFIKAEYENYGITYVLLGGDNEILPHRGMRSQIMDYGIDYYDDPDIASDMYFACLDGEWQNSGSQYYGEPGSEDLFFEVYVARFAVDSQVEFNNMFHKVLSYSNSPVNEMINKNLLVGEHLWGPPQFPTDTWGQAYMDEFLGECTASNYTTQGFTPNWLTETLYDVNGEWDTDDIIQTINSHRPVWIDHLGHSNVTYNMKMSDSDVNSINFTNNGENGNYFLIYSQGCYSGSFDNRTTYGDLLNSDCIGEKFTTIASAAAAYIGNSRYGLGSPYDTNGSGQIFHRYFHHALFSENIAQIEAMNAYSKEIAAPFILETNINLAPYYGQCKWIAYGLNTLGDPAMAIWTAPAQSLTATIPDSISANQTFQILTEPYAHIAFYNADKTIIATGTADSVGTYSLFEDHPYLADYIDQSNETVYTINIKADNFYPLQQSVYKSGANSSETVNIQLISSLQNYPNPFNPQTKISFELSDNAPVKLEIFNTKGQKVNTLISGTLQKGKHDFIWDGKDMHQNSLASGIYFCRLSFAGQSISRKMLMLK